MFSSIGSVRSVSSKFHADTCSIDESTLIFEHTGDPNQIKTVWDETLAWLAPAAAAKDGIGSPVVV